MATMELSLDPEVKEQFELLLARAKQERRSEQDVVAEMIRAYKGRHFLAELDRMQKLTEPIITKLGLKTDDDFERYLG
jgi:hypothetical protein